MKKDSTVQDFFDAIEVFLTNHPLPCTTCKEHCCKGRFKINMDCVAARRMSKGKLERILPKLFVDVGENKLEIFLVAGGRHCRHLNGLSRCLVYPERPAICRTYICIPRSRSYQILDAAVAAELHHGMRGTYLDGVIQDRGTPPEALEPARQLRDEIVSSSKAYGKNSYAEILLMDCVHSEFPHSNLPAEDAVWFREQVDGGEQ